MNTTSKEIMMFNAPMTVQSASDAMTDDEITAAALADPDNPPLREEEIERLTAARIAKRAVKREAE